jgi:hypothetical protein
LLALDGLAASRAIAAIAGRVLPTSAAVAST